MTLVAFVCGLDACEKCEADGKTAVDGCRIATTGATIEWIKPTQPWVSVTKISREQVHEAEGMPQVNIVKRSTFVSDEVIPNGFPTTLAAARPLQRASLEGRIATPV